MSPDSGPALIVVDGCFDSAALAAAATKIGTTSIVATPPVRVLEGTFAPDRHIALFRVADLNAASAFLDEGALRLLTSQLQNGAGARIAVGHHALGDDAPPAAAERDLAYLMVHGLISNREVYGAYLRGLRESNLLTTNGCERILMMGPSNVRRCEIGPMAPGEYFEILAFPTVSAIESFWLSPAYAELIALRRGALDVLAAILPPGGD